MMLWLLILMPLVGAGAICFAKASAAKWIAMVVTVAALALKAGDAIKRELAS